jgi:quinoprotein glucose dehydrogenase
MRKFLAIPAAAASLMTTLALAACAPGQGSADKPYSPTISPASNEALLGLKSIRLPKGLEISLFAAEPMLANPVCFCFDERNRIYVAETFRIHAGVEDTREHMHWLDDDLASRTVADRVAMYRKHLGNKIKSYGIEHDRIRLLEDVGGHGKADRSTVFADGFNQIPDGIGAGLLARDGYVWYTCIPNLWRLHDSKGTGKADERQALHYGYGVHVNYYGHDLHGLRVGPDGRLYFSIGDRGLHVETAGRTLDYPDTGAVLRCNLDGSELEVVASGLRNPQELAFDQYGNLFTGDNNSDSGDLARWVYVVEGGDSGWRTGFQYLDENPVRGPWNMEKMWLPQYEGQPAFIVPPIANVADGPAGLCYYPGVGLPNRYKDHFFLCDFRGSSSNSGIRSFAVKPKGASFEFVDQHEFIWNVLATDCDFGMDGGFYVLDWVEGWNGPGKGRIYKVADPSRSKDPTLLSVKKLMAEGMSGRSEEELRMLLEHSDMRVRLEAQFALVARAPSGGRRALTLALKSNNQLARLHALWGLGQIGRHANARTVRTVVYDVEDMLADADAEIRAQAARVLGDIDWASASGRLESLLKDPNPRVRFFAAMSLGKLGRKEAFKPILAMLRVNGDRDAYLRHAGVMALTAIHEGDKLAVAARDESAAVRLAVLLVLRRQGSSDIAQFLCDREPRLVLEAARAIHDVPIRAALPQLAGLPMSASMPEPLVRRVLNANFRLGKPENAAAVAAYAGLPDAPEATRIEALRELADWAKPSGRDRLMGLWRPLGTRPAHIAADALRPKLAAIFSSPTHVKEEATKVVAKLGLKEAGPVLVAMASDQHLAVTVRIETVVALEALQNRHLDQAIESALHDVDPRMRIEGCRVLARVQPAKAKTRLEAMLQNGSLVERQGALGILAGMKGSEADTLLSLWLDKLLAGNVDLPLQLDLLEAAARRTTADIKQKLVRYEAARAKDSPLARYREALAGGSAEAGRKVFFNKYEVSCLKCHKVQGHGGEVGPDLTGIGNRQKREYLLESIVDPNKEIAKGFESVVLGLTNGQVVTGIVKAEDANELKLITAEAKVLTIAKKDIEERSRGKSAMPEDVMKFLSRAELRDLVEFLASLK